jgi:hypothetical protein
MNRTERTQMNNVNIELLSKNVALTVTRKTFNNSRKADMSQISLKDHNDDDEEKAKARMRLKKQLLISPELDAINEHLGEVYKWVQARSMPSFFKDGVYLVKLSEVSTFEAKFSESLEKLSKLVRAFQDKYEEQKAEARTVLNGQFRDKDYPDVRALPARFGIEWNWISFGVPESLPAELRAAEAGKLEATFRDAEREILAALREGFAEIVSHVTDRLTVGPGEKQKIFRNTLFDDITEFIGTFNARNLVNDADLERLVLNARNILAEVRGENPSAQAEVVRDSKDLRERTAQKFAELKNAVDSIIIDRPSRKFNFDA